MAARPAQLVVRAAAAAAPVGTFVIGLSFHYSMFFQAVLMRAGMGFIGGAVMQLFKPLIDRAGLILWSVAIAATLLVAAMKPDVRSVVVAYEYGTSQFLAHQPLYDLNRAMGFLYPPAFAALYWPFYELGPVLGGLLWRTIGVCALTAATITQARRLDFQNGRRIASLAIFFALPLSLGAIRNGQSTVLLTAACWFLVMAAMDDRPGRVLLWTLVALLAKPTAIVVVLLVCALRPCSIPWTAAAIVALFVVPYAFGPVEYVNAQHAEFFRLLTSMGNNSAKEAFEAADFTGVLSAVGFQIDGNTATAIRLAMAAVVLSVVWALDREPEPQSGYLLFLFAAFYMTVFNPRVESNTYVLIAAPLGLGIAYLKDRKPSSMLPTVLGSVLFLAGLTGINATFHSLLNPWFKPLMTTLLVIPVVYKLLQKPEGGAEASTAKS